VIECLNPSLFRYDPLRGCVSVREILAEKSYFLIWSSSRIQAVSGLIERPQCRATKQSALPQQLMKFRPPPLPRPASSMMQGACGSLASPLISFPDIHGFYRPVSLLYLLLSHSSRSLEGDGQFEWGGEGEGGGSMILSLSLSVSVSL